MKIITLTLNPAFDIHCGTENFYAERENHMRSYRRHIGGKGVNVSRALHENGVKSTAFVVLGTQNSADFERELYACGINYIPIYINGRIRENITIHPENARETRISFEGCHVTPETAKSVFDRIIPTCNEDTIFSFNGRMPTGLPAKEVFSFLEEVKKTGAKLVIDSSSFTVDDFAIVKPWLIKPNQEEISACMGYPVESVEQALEAARTIHEKGIENVIVSLGGKGAVLVSSDVSCAVSVPKIEVVSTIGAGDSSVAGFIAAYSEGKSKEECLVRAVSYGSAACLTAGTNPPSREDVEMIRKGVIIKKM